MFSRPDADEMEASKHHGIRGYASLQIEIGDHNHGYRIVS